MTKKLQKSMYSLLANYLCNDESDYSLILRNLQTTLKNNPNETLDYVDRVDVWEKVEFKFTVKEFCDMLGLTETTELKIAKPAKPKLTNGKPKFGFQLGSSSIGTYNIDELRDIVEELKTKLGKGEEYTNRISDFIFSVEVAYQQYHELDENNWEMLPF